MAAHQGGQAAELIDVIGVPRWQARLAELRRMAGGSERVARALTQRHAIEVVLERLRRGQPAGPTAQAVATRAGDAVALMASLPPAGRRRMLAHIEAGLSGDGTLTGLFHVLEVAARQRARGFSVAFPGFAEGTPHDLTITRANSVAEVACDIVSAEEGRDVHRAAWLRLVDAVDPDLQTWLTRHPGRYLLKLTLNQGLKREDASLPAMHGRIRNLLASQRRSDQDAAAILRLDPLMLAAAQADEDGLMPSLRREFGHEAHLAVMTGSSGVCVLAARAGREDDVAAAIRRRMAAIAPARLSGSRPGILAMLVEDTDPSEWRHLRDQLEIEGAARQFLTEPAARHVVAVSCLSRRELFDAEPDSVAELRFRNPGHPAAKSVDLAAAILSS